MARVHQLVKGGMTKAAAFEEISGESGRAKDAVQMLYYRAIRAAKGGSKSAAKGTAGRASAAGRKSRRAPSREKSVIQSGEFPALLDGIASSINALLKHIEKTVEENMTLREQAERLKAITSLVRGK